MNSSIGSTPKMERESGRRLGEGLVVVGAETEEDAPRGEGEPPAMVGRSRVPFGRWIEEEDLGKGVGVNG